MNLLQLVVDGLVHGSILALVALGITLTWRILHFANVAHGEFVTVGAYSAYAIRSYVVPDAVVAGLVMGPVLANGAALAAAVMVTVGVALVINRLVFRPLSGRQPATLLISSIGVSLFLQGLIILVWGTQIRPYPIPMAQEVSVLGLKILPTDIPVVVGAVLLMAALHVFLRSTRHGREMRAMADSVDLARLSGIRPNRVVAVMWLVGGGLAAAAGLALAVRGVITPYLGFSVLIESFASAVLGGIGNPYGAIVGALIIGITQSLSTAVLAPPYKLAVAFGVLALVMLVRPTGLMGGRGHD